MQGQRQGSIPGCTRIFRIGVPDALKHLKNEMHTRKKEIGMNRKKKRDFWGIVGY